MARLRVAVADDDDDDYLMTEEAVDDLDRDIELTRYLDGRALLDGLIEAVAAGEPLPHLILMDLNMPRMDGREATKAIKMEPDLALIPVIVLTTSSNPGDIVGTYATGANAFITKPVTRDGFTEAVHNVLAVWEDIGTTPGRARDD